MEELEPALLQKSSGAASFRKGKQAAIVQLSSMADRNLEHVRYKHRKVTRRKCGVHQPPAAAIPHLSERPSQNHREATASLTSTQHKWVPIL